MPSIPSVFPSSDLWQHLQNSSKYIYLYGTGDGADKICAICDRYNIPVEGFFASDDFVRGQCFHDKPVLRFDQVCARHGAGNVLVLVAFATCLPSVMDNVKKIAACCETYLPEVPVRGQTLFTLAYAKSHAEELQAVYSLLADARSREVYADIIRFRLNGELPLLLSTEDERERTMQTLLHPEAYRSYCDVGAYDGDTIRELLALSPQLTCIHAIEPDRRNFRKLCATAREIPADITLTLHHCAAWNTEETLLFEDSGNRNAGYNPHAKKKIAIPAYPIDTLLGGERVDYIKYDVEGSDAQALDGSAATIRAHKPDLLLSLYHRTEDIFALPLQLHRICSEYRFYIRRYPYIPAWDLNLYATAR